MRCEEGVEIKYLGQNGRTDVLEWNWCIDILTEICKCKSV